MELILEVMVRQWRQPSRLLHCVCLKMTSLHQIMLFTCLKIETLATVKKTLLVNCCSYYFPISLIHYLMAMAY